MYIIIFLGFYFTSYVDTASYPRYGLSSENYPAYSSYSTPSGLYNSYKSGSYSNNLSPLSDPSRYPSYSPAYSSSNYGINGQSYTTGYNNIGYSSTGYNGLGYSTPGYNNGLGYSTPGYNNVGYSTPGYNNVGYSSQGYNSYSTPGYNSYSTPGYNNQGSGLGYASNGFNNNGYTTSRYNTYNTGGLGNSYYPGASSGISSGGSYGSPRYDQGYDQSYTSYETPYVRDMRNICVARPQNGIYIDSLMGMWNGVEVIYHMGGDMRRDSPSTCIVVHISEPKDMPSTENQLFHVQHLNSKFRHEFRHLRMVWDESGQTVEYALYFRNDSVGSWQVYNSQNGTMLSSHNNYRQFTGSVQVLKAVNDHMVLHFCQEQTEGKPAQLYSVLLSRHHAKMERWEKDSVHNMLQNKKLSTASVRMVCGNNADRPIATALISILTCLLAFILKSS